jgi:hypothetical protein
MGVARPSPPSPFYIYHHVQSCGVSASAERADTLTLFLLYPYMYSVRCAGGCALYSLYKYDVTITYLWVLSEPEQAKRKQFVVAIALEVFSFFFSFVCKSTVFWLAYKNFCTATYAQRFFWFLQILIKKAGDKREVFVSVVDFEIFQGL